MRSRFLPLLLLPALLAAGPLQAAPPAPEAIANPEITAAELREHVRYLASDELAGRGSGTSGNDQAADYLAERFRAAGLRPAGVEGTYFQPFQVFTGVRLGSRGELAVRHAGRRQTFRAGEEYMPLSFSKNGTAAAPLVFAGYGISRPELGYDDYKGLDARGKIVVVLRHTPDADDNGKFAPYARLSYKTLTAREKGAAGILLVTGPLNEGPEDLGQFRLESASADCGIPAAIVKRSVVEPLLAPLNLRDLQIMIAHGKTQSRPLPGATALLRADVVRESATTRNVLGLVEGSDPRLKDEVVVVGAHYDHLGMGGSHSLSASSKPEIHYGADDNASGTAGVLELAQYFAANRERLGRSVLFMGFSGEEMGLLGSAHWTRQPTIPLKRVAAMVNMDMIGRGQNDAVFVMGTGTSPAWQAVLDEANAPHRLTLRTGGSALSGFGGSDQQSFYVKNIPVLFFFTGTHADYHKPSDTWEKVNVEGEAKLLQVIASVVSRVSRLDARPAFTRAPEAERSPGGGGFRVYLGTVPDYAAMVEGVQLQGVREGSPAEKAGIRAGDILVEFDGKKIRNVEEYTVLLSGARPNVPVRVVVRRGGERVTLSVVPRPRAN